MAPTNDNQAHTDQDFDAADALFALAQGIFASLPVPVAYPAALVNRPVSASTTGNIPNVGTPAGQATGSMVAQSTTAAAPALAGPATVGATVGTAVNASAAVGNSTNGTAHQSSTAAPALAAPANVVAPVAPAVPAMVPGVPMPAPSRTDGLALAAYNPWTGRPQPPHSGNPLATDQPEWTYKYQPGSLANLGLKPLDFLGLKLSTKGRPEPRDAMIVVLNLMPNGWSTEPVITRIITEWLTPPPGREGECCDYGGNTTRKGIMPKHSKGIFHLGGSVGVRGVNAWWRRIATVPERDAYRAQVAAQRAAALAAKAAAALAIADGDENGEEEDEDDDGGEDSIRPPSPPTTPNPKGKKNSKGKAKAKAGPGKMTKSSGVTKSKAKAKSKSKAKPKAKVRVEETATTAAQSAAVPEESSTAASPIQVLSPAGASQVSGIANSFQLPPPAQQTFDTSIQVFRAQIPSPIPPPRQRSGTPIPDGFTGTLSPNAVSTRPSPPPYQDVPAEETTAPLSPTHPAARPNRQTTPIPHPATSILHTLGMFTPINGHQPSTYRELPEPRLDPRENPMLIQNIIDNTPEYLDPVEMSDESMLRALRTQYSIPNAIRNDYDVATVARFTAPKHGKGACGPSPSSSQ